MGNNNSIEKHHRKGGNRKTQTPQKTFPGSALLDGTAMLCGFDTSGNGGTCIQQVDRACVTTPPKEEVEAAQLEEMKRLQEKNNPTSALFARALVSEVTDNPKTMTPAKMAEREKRLLKAQDAATKKKKEGGRAVGIPGGVGEPTLLGSISHVLGTGSGIEKAEDNDDSSRNISGEPSDLDNTSKYRITIGLSLSRRNSTLGHPDTVTRQTSFDFNELQDREYKFVSTTDPTGWHAGGGECGGTQVQANASPMGFDNNKSTISQPSHKIAAPDITHIPIIHIDAESPHAIDVIISALARGEIFIPHMAILPEALSVNGLSPPDLVLRFGCERTEETTPEEWPNWCLEFMHNQLYEYFASMGAKWMQRPFQVTLAKKVRWKTVKHMNHYFSHAERVLDGWREKGPQLLDPQLSYIEGGATPEEVARPHGIYLFRNGVPTNYFAPNFDPPYTTKMTRSLLSNVLEKSWDKKRREWTTDPLPRLLTPRTLLTNLCGMSQQGGFMANEVTTSFQGTPQATVVDSAVTRDDNSIVDDEAPTTTPFSQPHFQLPPIETTLGKKSPDRGAGYNFISPTSVESSPSRTLKVRERPRPEVSPSGAAMSHINNFVQVSNGENSPRRKKQELNNKKKSPKQNSYVAEEIARLQMQDKENSRPGTMDKTTKNKKKLEPVDAGTNYEEKKSDSPPQSYTTQLIRSPKNTSVPRIDSNMSLDYSIDSSLLGGGDSSVTGNYFNAESPASAKLKENAVTAAVASRRSILPPEDPSVGPSIGSGSITSGNTNTTEVIPSDEELFAIGWAKALDDNSGAYYYFTLDRSKIIWENPLVGI